MIKLSTSHFWVIAIAIFSSCGSYQKLLKSNDLDYKFDEAVQFFDDEEYIKAFPIFNELLLLYRGTDKAEDVYYYYSKIEFEKGNYLSAAFHLNNFSTTYKENPKAGSVSSGMPLPIRLFKARLERMKAAANANDKDTAIRMRDSLRTQVEGLPENSVVVKDKASKLYKVQNDLFWEGLI